MIVRIVPLFAAALLCFGCSSAPETPPPAQGPALGVETRSPSSTEIESFGIERKLAGRPEGRVLSAVEKGSPAEKAGLKTDDLLIAFGDHALFSHDDLADAVRASDSGEAVTLRIKRSGTREEIRVPVTMGQVATAKGIHWEFAGPAQFDAALAEAKKRGTKLMVGVSGAET